MTADLLEKWSASGALFGGAVAITTNGRRGSGGARITPGTANNSSTAYLQKSLAPVDATTCILGVAINAVLGTAGAAGMPLVQIRATGGPQITLRVDSAGTLTVTRGQHNGTVLGTTTATIPSGAFAYVELRVVIHASAGVVALRINGASALSLTGQNTSNTGTTAWSNVVLGIFDSVGSTNTQAGGTIDFDDLYVLDGSGTSPWQGFLGDCRVDARLPTGAGASVAWAPSAGANWSCVDEAAPNDDTDYVAAASTGLTDTHVTQDAPVAGAAIFGVQHCLAMKKSDTGTCAVAPVIRHAGTDYAGADLNPGTTYTYGLAVQPVNPGTGVQWTESGFNAAEFGYRRTA